MEKKINKQYNFDKIKQLKCECGMNISYSMNTIMSLFDTNYIECPHCNLSYGIDINNFKIKENE